MTDDLVKRLREGPTIDSCDSFDLVREAADEIERLRAALREIAELNLYEAASFAIYTARAALKENDDENNGE